MKRIDLVYIHFKKKNFIPLFINSTRILCQNINRSIIFSWLFYTLTIVRNTYEKDNRFVVVLLNLQCTTHSMIIFICCVHNTHTHIRTYTLCWLIAWLVIMIGDIFLCVRVYVCVLFILLRVVVS